MRRGRKYFRERVISLVDVPIPLKGTVDIGIYSVIFWSIVYNRAKIYIQ